VGVDLDGNPRPGDICNDIEATLSVPASKIVAAL
jgi:hypothetical protein